MKTMTPVEIADEAIAMFIEELDRRNLHINRDGLESPHVLISCARASAIREVQDAQDFDELPGEGPDDMIDPDSNLPLPRRRPHLFVDATISVPDARGIVTVSFGPFGNRAEAERALTSFSGRENAMGAALRDPNG